MATISVTDVSKSFNGSLALHPLDLTVDDGSFCCMLGSSGSGKSTLLRIIAGLSEPDSGTISIGDRDVTRLPSEKRNIGFVFQNYALFPHLSVGANVAFGLRARGINKSDARDKVEAMLKLVGLSDFGGRSPKQLSGGQQQRVALARALVTGPDVLLLDEPLSALDRKIRGEMQAELKRIHGETGLTTIMVTHDQEEAMNLGDTVLMLSHGKVQQFDGPEAVYRQPANGFVADFLGAISIGRGKIVDAGATPTVELGGVRFALDRTAVPVGTAVDTVVMSERVTLTAAAARPQEPGEYEATVAAIEFFGPFARAQATIGTLTIPAMMLSQHALPLQAGAKVWLRVAAGGVHAFAEHEKHA